MDACYGPHSRTLIALVGDWLLFIQAFMMSDRYAPTDTTEAWEAFVPTFEAMLESSTFVEP